METNLFNGNGFLLFNNAKTFCIRIVADLLATVTEFEERLRRTFYEAYSLS